MASQPWRDQQLWCKQLPKRHHCQKWGLAKWHMWITGWLVWACLSMTSLSRIWETLYDLARYTHKLSVQILHCPHRKIPKVPVANNIYRYIYAKYIRIYIYKYCFDFIFKKVLYKFPMSICLVVSKPPPRGWAGWAIPQDPQQRLRVRLGRRLRWAPETGEGDV